MAEEATVSSGTESSSDNERSSSENVTIIAETFSDIAPSTTLSSVQSDDSAKQLICKTPQSPKSKPKHNIDMKSATVESEFVESMDKSRHSPETMCSKSILTSLHSDISLRDHSERRPSRLILYLGIAQLLVGVLMVIAGGLVIIHEASLSRTGAGLWAGCLAIATGILGVLAGINDCYGLYDKETSRMGNLFLTLFLALSLIALAAGNLAAVLAGTGLLRDVRRPPSTSSLSSDQGEFAEIYWPPILANIGLLLASALHCLLALISVYHTAKRVCSCFRPREPFNHNQFDPTYSNLQQPYSVMSVSEKAHEKASKYSSENQVNGNQDNRKDLNQMLEGKLMSSGSDTDATDGHVLDGKTSKSDHRKMSHDIGGDPHGVGSYFGSANSKDKLVFSWLGGHPGIPIKLQKVPKNGIKKGKMKQQPVFLLPATAGNTLTRPVPVPMVPVSASRLGYATLPMVPAGPHARPLTRPMAPPPPHMLYPPVYAPYSVNDMVRVKRKRYASSSASPSNQERRRSNQLTRSLERIYRQRKPSSEEKSSRRDQKAKKSKNKSKPVVSDADVIRTYTGLDRTIAEQFINACNENRHGGHIVEPTDHSSSKSGHRDIRTDSSGFDTNSSGSHINRY
ncbi:uncharacterized protein LOC143919122 [Arctopsyche grandis]|uniref:uncharacterized protein LOC143919122 n=1 Tax=Arctopsyche grandis TaxID=121162 RepID=UPI00406D8C08